MDIIHYKKIAIWFSKNEGGGVKGRLEFFQKIIRFVILVVGPFPKGEMGEEPYVGIWQNVEQKEDPKCRVQIGNSM